jgi:hypothetical protein
MVMSRRKTGECCTAERVDKGYGRLQYAVIKLTGIFPVFAARRAIQTAGFPPANFEGLFAAQCKMPLFKNDHSDLMLKIFWRFP